MKKIVVLSMLILFTIKCSVYKDCKKISLPIEEMEWFKPYKKSKILLFQSNLFRIDSLEVSRIENKYTPCNKFELGSFQYNYYSVALHTKLLNYSSFESVNFDFEIENQYDTISKKTISVLDLVFCGKTFDNVKYEDVVGHDKKDTIKAMKFDTSNSKSFGNHIISSFNWSKEIGLVQYTTSNGEIFKLVK